MTTVLVDTNVLSETVRSRPSEAVLGWLAAHPSFAVSVITLDELALGIERLEGKRRARLREWLDHLRDDVDPEIIPIDAETALAAGSLRAARERRGRRVAQADMLIAATALVRGLTLATRNVEDFEGCGVALLNPFDV